MKITVWARVGCTFELDCEPNARAIKKALTKEIEKIPCADGETYVPEVEGSIPEINLDIMPMRHKTHLKL